MSCAPILFVCLGGSSVSAAEPAPLHLEADDPAPYAGELLTIERVIKLGQKAERCEFLLERDAVRLTRLFEIDLQLERGKLEIEVERGDLREAAHKRQMERSWVEHPALVAVVTMVATYAILRAAKDLP